MDRATYLQALRELLDNAYPGVADADASIMLNANGGGSVVRKVPFSELFGYMDRTGRWPMIVMAADHGTAPDGSAMPLMLRYAAIQAVETRRYSRYDELDVHHPMFAVQCDALVSAGLLTADHKIDLIDVLGRRVGTQAEAVFGAGVVVTPSDIADARRL